MTVPLRAALYLRVSTARQAERDVSIPDQKQVPTAPNDYSEKQRKFSAHSRTEVAEGVSAEPLSKPV
jgi:DNA invertase Pin-like site-specific DNA recombinase